jgi:hypothetical protein
LAAFSFLCVDADEEDMDVDALAVVLADALGGLSCDPHADSGSGVPPACDGLCGLLALLASTLLLVAASVLALALPGPGPAFIVDAADPMGCWYRVE